MTDRENKNYIASRVHPIFEKMVVDILLVKPEDLVSHMSYIVTEFNKLGGLHDWMARR